MDSADSEFTVTFQRGSIHCQKREVAALRKHGSQIRQVSIRWNEKSSPQANKRKKPKRFGESGFVCFISYPSIHPSIHTSIHPTRKSQTNFVTCLPQLLCLSSVAQKRLNLQRVQKGRRKQGHDILYRLILRSKKTKGVIPKRRTGKDAARKRWLRVCLGEGRCW